MYRLENLNCCVVMSTISQSERQSRSIGWWQLLSKLRMYSFYCSSIGHQTTLQQSNRGSTKEAYNTQSITGDKDLKRKSETILD